MHRRDGWRRKYRRRCAGIGDQLGQELAQHVAQNLAHDARIGAVDAHALPSAAIAASPAARTCASEPLRYTRPVAPIIR